MSGTVVVMSNLHDDITYIRAMPIYGILPVALSYRLLYFLLQQAHSLQQSYQIKERDRLWNFQGLIQIILNGWVVCCEEIEFTC